MQKYVIITLAVVLTGLVLGNVGVIVNNRYVAQWKESVKERDDAITHLQHQIAEYKSILSKSTQDQRTCRTDRTVVMAKTVKLFDEIIKLNEQQKIAELTTLQEDGKIANLKKGTKVLFDDLFVVDHKVRFRLEGNSDYWWTTLGAIECQ